MTLCEDRLLMIGTADLLAGHISRAKRRHLRLGTRSRLLRPFNSVRDVAA